MSREKAKGNLPEILEAKPGTIRDIPAEPWFDTILYIDVLEHIEDAKQELVWAVERLRSGGYLVVLAPAHQWLFTPFDKAIGHFRRYSRKSLVSLMPTDVDLIKIIYLDSVGLIASLGNRFLLGSSMPTRQQIKVWDNTMVRASRLVDRLTRYSLGKSVLAVWTKRLAPSNLSSCDAWCEAFYHGRDRCSGEGHGTPS